MHTLRKHLFLSLAITLVAFWFLGCGGSSSSSNDDEILAEMVAEQASDSSGQTTIETTEGGTSRDDGPVAVAANGTEMKVLVLGDSNTAGVGVSEPWPDKLELALGAPVFRQGVEGSNSADGLARLPGAIDQFQPTHVCLQFGDVDALQLIDPSITLNNLGVMVDICTARGLPVVVGTLVPLINVDAERNAIRLVTDNGIGLATARGARVARISEAFGEGTTLMQADGIHANDAGHAIIASLYLEQLR